MENKSHLQNESFVKERSIAICPEMVKMMISLITIFKCGDFSYVYYIIRGFALPPECLKPG